MQADLIQLGFDGSNHLGVTVTDVENSVAAQTIQITFAVIVVGINTSIPEFHGAFGTAQLVGIGVVQIIDGIFQRRIRQLFIVSRSAID